MYIHKTAETAASAGSPKPIFMTSRRPFRKDKPGTIGHWNNRALDQ